MDRFDFVSAQWFNGRQDVADLFQGREGLVGTPAVRRLRRRLGDVFNSFIAVLVSIANSAIVGNNTDWRWYFRDILQYQSIFNVYERLDTRDTG